MITGANRGLGLEFARQYAGEGWRVLGCCRNPSAAAELNDLAASNGAATVHALDVDDGASVARCRPISSRQAIDILINNAGVIGSRGGGLGSMDYEAFEPCLQTNVLGPLRVAEAFIDSVGASHQRKLLTISSRMGSISQTAANSMVYRTSKAAVNMLMACVSSELGPKGIVTAVFHPGWVQTDMGGAGAAMTAVESVGALRRTFARLGPADNGCFINYDGSPIPW